MGYLFLMLVFALFGLRLVRKGRQGKRVGLTPHCSRCDYNLTSLESEHCPECGLHLVGLRKVYGDRRRSPGHLWGGLGLLVVSGFFGFRAVTHYRVELIDRTYPYWPTSWVMRELQSADSGHRFRAQRDLRRRLAEDKLSPKQKRDLARVVIKTAVPMLVRTGAVGLFLFELSEDLLADGVFTDAELQMYFRSLERAFVRYEAPEDRHGPCLLIDGTMFAYPDIPGATLITRRRMVVRLVDGQPCRELVLEKYRSGYARSDRLPIVPQYELVVEITTSWYDFAPTYDDSDIDVMFELWETRRPDEVLDQAPRKLICEYTDTLVLTPQSGWEAEVPPTTTQPASAIVPTATGTR